MFRNTVSPLLINKDTGIIRNRRKVESAIRNAGAFLGVVEEYGSFDEYIWGYVGGSSVMNEFGEWSDVPAETEVSRAMSRSLKEMGFSFVGPTICYALHAVGWDGERPPHQLLQVAGDRGLAR